MPFIIDDDQPLRPLLYWRYSSKIPGGFYVDSTKDVYRHGTHFSQVQQLQLPPPEGGALYDPKQPAPAFAFDTQQELLWVGNESVSDYMWNQWDFQLNSRIGPDNFVLRRRSTKIYLASGTSIP